MSKSRHCPECGTELPAGVSLEMCPKCLMAAALEDSSSTAGQAPPDESQIDETIDSDANLAGPSRGRVSPRLDAGRGETDPRVDQTLDSDVADASASSERLRRGEKVRYFGDYEIIEEIARGGMGVVYKARQVKLDRIVALKMIIGGQLAGDTAVQRFYTEAQAAAKLDHVGIVPIFEVGEHEGHHFFSMGLIEGQSLADRLRDGPLPPKEAARLIRQAAEAVAYAHEQGVIHRDIKPANILLESRESRVESLEQEKGRDSRVKSLEREKGQASGVKSREREQTSGSRPSTLDFGLRRSGLSTLDSRPKLTDFGLAKRTSDDSGMTATGQILGTPSFMPPEQAAGKMDEIGPLADVYSLGATLYATLTGRPPFQGASILDTIQQLKDQEPIAPRLLNPKIPQDLETICLKCLEKETHKRYATAEELANELGRFLGGEPIKARPISRPARLWRWCRRKPVLAGISAALILALIVGFAGITTQWLRAQREWARAEENAGREKQAAEAAAEAQKDAERLLRISQSQRLVVQAEAERDSSPVRSLLLAVEAVEATRRYNEPVLPVAAQALRKALREVGGRPLHENRATAVAMSPDGHWLVTGGQDGNVQIWDFTASKPQPGRLLNAHEGQIDSIRFHSDNHRFATASSVDGIVQVWNLAADDPLASRIVLRGLEYTEPPVVDEYSVDPIAMTVFSPEGRWLIGVSLEKTCLWDLEADDPSTPVLLLGPMSWSYTWFPEFLPFSADSHWFVHAGADGFRLYDLSAQEVAASETLLPGTPPQDSNRGRSVVWAGFTPDNRWLITNRNLSPRMNLWDLTEEAPTASCIRLNENQETPTRSLFAISSDGRWLATTSGDAASRLFDLTAKDPSLASISLPGTPGSNVQISPDNHWLFTSTGQEPPTLWDLTSEDPSTNPVVLPIADGPTKLCRAHFSGDGQWMVTSVRQGSISLWNLAAENPTASAVVLQEAGEEGFAFLTFSDGGRWLVGSYCVSNTGRPDPTVRVWDLASKDIPESARALRGHSQLVGPVQISPDQRWMVTGTVSRDVSQTEARLWDLEATDGLAAADVVPTQEPVWGFEVSADGRWLAAARPETYGVSAANNAGVQLWSLAAKDPAATKIAFEGAAPIALTPNGRWLVTSRRDRYDKETGRPTRREPHIVRLWDLEATDPTASPIVLQGEKAVERLLVSLDSRWLLTFDRDGGGWRWDLLATEPAKSVVAIPGYPQAEGIYREAISPDGRWLAAVGSTKSENDSGASIITPESSVQIWSLDDDGQVPSPVSLAGHEGAIFEMAFTPNGHWLATASQDGTVRFWDLTAPNPVAACRILEGHEKAVVSMSLSADGQFLITRDTDHGPNGFSSSDRSRVWRLNDSDPAASTTVLEPFDGIEPCLGISPDGRWLATQEADDGRVTLWDLNAVDPAANSLVLPGYFGQLEQAVFSPDCRWLLTVGEIHGPTGMQRGEAQLWDLTAIQQEAVPIELHGESNGVGTVTFTRDSRWLITSEYLRGGGYRIRLRDIRIEAWLAAARETAGRELTSEERRMFLLDEVPPEQIAQADGSSVRSPATEAAASTASVRQSAKPAAASSRQPDDEASETAERLRMSVDQQRQRAEKVQQELQVAQQELQLQRERLEQATAVADEGRMGRVLELQAEHLLEQNDNLGALLYFAEAAKLEQEEPNRTRVHQLRLSTVLRGTPQLRHELQQADGMQSIAFLGNGERLLTLGRHDVVVWDLATGEQLINVTSNEIFGDSQERQAYWCLTNPRGGQNEQEYRLEDSHSGDGRYLAVVWSEDTQVEGRPIEDGPAVDGPAVDGPGTDGSATDALVAEERSVKGNTSHVTVLDLENGQAVMPVVKVQDDIPRETFDGAVRHVALSHDGSRLAITRHGHHASASYGDKPAITARDGEVELWDVRGGKRLATLAHSTIDPENEEAAKKGSFQRIRRAIFSANGKRLLTISLRSRSSTQFDGGCKMRVWDAETGKSISPPIETKLVIREAKLSANGDRVFAFVARSFRGRYYDRSVHFASTEPRLRVWDAATGKQLEPTPDADADPNQPNPPQSRSGRAVPSEHDVWLNKDASVVASTAHPSVYPLAGMLWLRDVESRRALGPPIPLYGELKHVALTGDQKVLALVEDGGPLGINVRLWDTVTGKPAAPLLRQNTGVTSLSLDPSGTRLAVTRQGGRTRVWNLATDGMRPTDRRTGGSFGLGFAAVSPHASRCVTFGQRFEPGSSSHPFVLSAWNSLDPEAPLEFTLHEDIGRLWDVSFDQDGARVLVAGSSSGSSSILDSIAQVFDLQTGKAIMPNPLRIAKGSQLHSALSPDGKRLAVTNLLDADGTAWAGPCFWQVWDVDTGEPVTERVGLPTKREELPDYCEAPAAPGAPHANALAFDPSGQHLATVQDRHVIIWNVQTAQPRHLPSFDVKMAIQSVPQPAPYQRHVAFSPDGSRLAAVWNTGAVVVWNLQGNGEPWAVETHLGTLEHIAFSPDGKRLVTTSQDHTARIWDAATGQPIGPPINHPAPVRYATFDPTGTVLLTVSNGSRLWDATTGAPASPWISADMTGATFTDDGNWLVSPTHRRNLSPHEPAVSWQQLAETLSLRRLATGGRIEQQPRFSDTGETRRIDFEKSPNPD